MIAILIYVIFALICGLLGKNTRLGFGGVFVLTLLLTPVITLAYLFFLKEPNKNKA